jgi:flagellar basal body-associated protein FliL
MSIFPFSPEAEQSELSPEKKKIKLIIILGLTVLLLLGIAAYFFANNI